MRNEDDDDGTERSNRTGCLVLLEDVGAHIAPEIGTDLFANHPQEEDAWFSEGVDGISDQRARYQNKHADTPSYAINMGRSYLSVPLGKGDCRVTSEIFTGKSLGTGPAQYGAGSTVRPEFLAKALEPDSIPDTPIEDLREGPSRKYRSSTENT